MHVAWFLNDLGGGGAERLPLVLAPAFRETELHLILLKDRTEHAIPEPRPRITALGPGEARLSRALGPLFRGATRAAHDADLLVGGMEWDSTLMAAAVGGWLRKPAVALVHTDLRRVYGPMRIPGWRWRLLAWALRRCDAVIGVSPEAIDSARRLGVPERRCHVIPNPAPPTTTKARRSADHEPARLLSVGRLMAVKGIDVMLEAASRLDVPFQWEILGHGPDREALDARASDLGLQDRLRMRGFVPDPSPFFAAADLFVSASRMEGMPLAMMEAMQHGLPVVSTRCGHGVESLVGEGAEAAGLLVPVDDPAALAAAIREALSLPERMARWSEHARRRAAELAPERIAPRYEALFRAVVSGRSLGSA